MSQSFHNMNFAPVAQYAGGGIATGSKQVNPAFVKFLGAASRYAAPVIGGVIDYGVQIAGGENSNDALVKATAHTAIAAGAAIVGKTAGTAVAAAAASTVVLAPVAPILGFATDFLVTSAISIGGSWLFDTVYDNKDEIINSVKDSITNVGNAISGMVSDWGTALGW